mgnify:CR=1 FL=1
MRAFIASPAEELAEEGKDQRAGGLAQDRAAASTFSLAIHTGGYGVRLRNGDRRAGVEERIDDQAHVCDGEMPIGPRLAGELPVVDEALGLEMFQQGCHDFAERFAPGVRANAIVIGAELPDRRAEEPGGRAQVMANNRLLQLVDMTGRIIIP